MAVLLAPMALAWTCLRSLGLDLDDEVASLVVCTSTSGISFLSRRFLMRWTDVVGSPWLARSALISSVVMLTGRLLITALIVLSSGREYV